MCACACACACVCVCVTLLKADCDHTRKEIQQPWIASSILSQRERGEGGGCELFGINLSDDAVYLFTASCLSSAKDFWKWKGSHLSATRINYLKNFKKE